MDAEKLLGEFTPQETQEVAAALPAEVLRAEAVRRGIAIPEGVGAVAAHSAGVEADAVSGEDQAFKDKVGDFLNPKVELNLEGQLEVTDELWHRLGHARPQLSDADQQKLRQTLEANPGKRVVPTPLLGLDERTAITEKGRKLPGQQFSTRYDALWIPGADSLYGKLLRDPQSTVKDGRSSYALRYKTPDGYNANRAVYIDSLKENGQAVVAEDGTVWTFPVMDVQVRSERTYDSAGNLHKAVDPIVSPESLIVTQLLHQANGTPNPEWEVDFANEAVVELDRKGEDKALVQVAGVDWYPDYRQVYLRSWGAGNQRGYFGVRGAESGLKS